MKPKSSPLSILLVDDDDTDRELCIEGLNRTGIPYFISEASNGEEAFAYLNQAAMLPDIIVLDMNMPVKDGRQTLKELKAHENFKRIPVFIMSTSKAHFDVSYAYEYGANMYLVKPHDFKDLVELLTCVLKVFNKYTAFPTRPEY